MSRYQLWGLLGPSTWIAWCLIAAALATAIGGRRASRLARIAVFAGAALTVIFLALPTGHWLMEPLERRFPAYSGPPLDDVVVLAGGEQLTQSVRSGRPEYGEHGERALNGAVLARQWPTARLWAVGGIRRERGPYDVDWMIALWTSLGVPRARIVRIADTTDTCGNADGVARRIAPARRVALVTSAFHMPRAVACFRAAGVTAVPVPVDYQNGPPGGLGGGFSVSMLDDLRRIDLALHEYTGLLWYRLSGRTSELWPAPTRATAASAVRPLESPSPATSP